MLSLLKGTLRRNKSFHFVLTSSMMPHKLYYIHKCCEHNFFLWPLFYFCLLLQQSERTFRWELGKYDIVDPSSMFCLYTDKTVILYLWYSISRQNVFFSLVEVILCDIYTNKKKITKETHCFLQCSLSRSLCVCVCVSASQNNYTGAWILILCCKIDRH